MVRYLLIAAGLALGVIYFGRILWAMGNIFIIVKPLILGVVIAYVLNIPMKQIERMYFPKSKNALVLKSKKPVSLILSILVILLVFAGITNIVLPQIIDSFSIIGDSFQKFGQLIAKHINESGYKIPIMSEQLKNMDIDWEGLTSKAISYLKVGSDIFSSSVNIVSTLVSGIFNFAMSSVFAVYLLVSKDTLIGQIKRVQKAFMKEGHSQRLNNCLTIFNDAFSSFITGQCTEAVVIGVLCTCGMWVFRFPYATTIGVIVGVTALIPIIGAYVGAGVGAFLILMVSPVKAIWFLVFIIVLQQIESNLIYPRVVGTSIGLPGIWVIAAVVVGGGLGGIAGMLFGVPVAAALYKLLQIRVRERLNK